ncbi:hypothetical protein Clacol_008730 [Clathrus columnatus]|uniref:AMP-dependent synthetase/ligase domain-containing protein n=1 Tax=Clathrus columnatus TaxID=1419009 RepID=A0AAV5AQ04_9AGAM|nr:hypothetical protein Clacol_008730 [Clathrus columnatus]
MTYHSHLTIIEATATRSPRRSAFKLPQLDIGDETPHQKIIGWRDITYGKFHRDIVWCASYWVKKLQSPHGSVVGLWMSGLVYRDFVNLFGLMKAGFVPQILNVKIPSIEVAKEYFKQSNITNIIYAPIAPADQLKNDFHVHALIDPPLETYEIPDIDIPPSSKEEHEDDIVLFFHTSGSTSGRPKLVPYTRKWIDGHSKKLLPGLLNGKEIGIGINGIVHLSQFGRAELVQIITECKANALYQLTPIFGRVLREAMKNDDLRVALKSLNFVAYGGSAFGDNERFWAIENGIPLKNIYGTTEFGIAMVSENDPTILHPIKLPGILHEFISQESETEVESKEPRNRHMELVISPSSIDRPHRSLCGPDGRYHTKDLFEEVEPNGFVYRGRLDDIIKMSKVGSGKPSPVLLAEPLDEKMDIKLLKEKIGKKAELINEDGFPHERIRRTDVLIIPSGALPRTPKGNINRSTAERLFQREIDAFFDE